MTRPREKNSRLAEILYDLGAEVLEAPSIQIRTLEDHCFLEGMEEKIGEMRLDGIYQPDSGGSVFRMSSKKKKIDIRRLGGIRIAAVGSATAGPWRSGRCFPTFCLRIPMEKPWRRS